MEQEKGKQKNHSLKSDNDSSPLPLVQLEAADFELMADELMAAECFELSTDFDVDVDNSSIHEELAASCGRNDLRMCTVNLTGNATHSRRPEHQISHQQRPQSIAARDEIGLQDGTSTDRLCQGPVGAPSSAQHSDDTAEMKVATQDRRKERPVLANGKDTEDQEPNTAEKPRRPKAGRYSDRLVHSQSNKQHDCSVCGAAFASSEVLAQHSRIHTGEKPLKCDVCGAAFSHPSRLTSHSLTHTGEKPFKCDVCGLAFSQSGTLTVHSRIHTGEKPFNCDVCCAAFSRSDSLTVHSRIHTGEKPFKCDVCGAAFSVSGNLTVHSRIHTGEKLFKCDVCGAAFSQSRTLTKHSRTHTGVKS